MRNFLGHATARQLRKRHAALAAWADATRLAQVILPTPLHLVAQNGQVEALESLIAAGKAAAPRAWSNCTVECLHSD